MRPKAKYWLESPEGNFLLGPGTLRLLLAVAEEGSLKAGAKRIGLSYRSAWDRLQQAEANIGFALLERHSGGGKGGGSSLTEQAAELVERYRKFLSAMEDEIERNFAKAFKGWGQ
jgi:molybdate transport system regulatory protein